ncbi:hypothetical protein CEXT_488481 [Caerostris extrusa]|uniref:Uncharacterized protein n=1 Tax=Caerostris extrusa TaxID=172846 RepID=A0AAV4RGL4_CAEEX|nr:hypothetical protein CEXT_488481 [Caerostris extrusa]
MDTAIAQLGVPLAKLPQTKEELEQIVKSVAERRDPKTRVSHPPKKSGPSGTKPQTKRKSPPETKTG